MAHRTRTFGIKRRTITAAVLVLAIAGCLYLFLAWRAATQFEYQYLAYATAEQAYLTAAYKPAVESNPVRRQVNLILSQVLQVHMTQSERLERAKQGIAHLNDMERQIDEIKKEADKVIPLLETLEKTAGSIGNVRQHESTKEIVSLAKRQIEIISDIRGLSYRADYYTSEVFERIIDDQGEMTDEHKAYLNERIPQLEEQFNQRSNLYAELKQNDDTMKRIAHDLGYETP